MILNKLFGSSDQDGIGPYEQLAMVVAIRKDTGKSRLLQIEKVHMATPIVTHTKAMLNFINS